MLAKEETRLRHARADLLRCLCRPEPLERFEQPLFAVKELRSILRRRRWGAVVSSVGPIGRMDNKLTRALHELDRQDTNAGGRVAFFQHQRVAALLFQGVIAAARANNQTSDAGRLQYNSIALDRFRSASDVRGNNDDLDVLEFKGQQLLRLGEYELAADAFRRMTTVAIALPLSRPRRILVARAKRFTAQALYCRNPAALAGYNLLTETLAELAPLAHLTGGDRLEKAEAHELQARIGFALDFIVVAPNCLSEARTAFEVLKDLTKRRRRPAFRSSWRRLRHNHHDAVNQKLHKAAIDGLDRCHAIATEHGLLAARANS